MSYGYHLTTRNAALKIKTQGLQSSETRLGMAVANPAGAFAKNREAMEPKLRADRLKRDLAALMFAGAAAEQLLQVQIDEIPITDYRPLGVDASADLLALDEAAAAALERFKAHVPAIANKPLVAKGALFVKVWRGADVAKAVPLFQARLTHFLTRLAVQFTQLHYRVEELQTATHVYFSKPEDAVALYPSYKKHLGNETPLVVLRVELDKVAWEVDLGQGGAIKVKNGVAPELLEVMEHHARFAEEAWRSSAANWKALSAFDAPVVRERPHSDYA